MGNSTSTEQATTNVDYPPAPTPSERYFGLLNFGNTCYCNSVLQALYRCRPFRDRVLAYSPADKKADTLLTSLADLFSVISAQRRRSGVLSPKKFVAKLKKENSLFDNFSQQDAHEFLNYLLNHIADLLDGERPKPPDCAKAEPARPNWVHEIFQGTLTNETRCLTCETINYRCESFLDLSVDISENMSISSCLRGFSVTETLSDEYKYYCETCRSKQEAQKRMLIKKMPHILALHLKRFKYQEQLQRFTKLNYRIAFTTEMRLYNTARDTPHADRLYQLVAVVVHCGSGPSRGHYITLVKAVSGWIIFDDDIIERVDLGFIEEFYGVVQDTRKPTESGYILFYETVG